MTSRMSYNADMKAIPDMAKLKSHLQALQPVAFLGMDGLAACGDIAALLPTCKVIHRDYATYNGDDDLHKKVSPQAWLDDQVKKGYFNIWRSVLNESGDSAEVIHWLETLIHLNANRAIPLKLVIGNFSVGTPNPNNLGALDELLKLCDLYREWLILGLHEYFNAVPTSGFYGGYPDHAGVQPGQSGGANLIPAANWPADTKNITLFHCGRFRFWLAHCEAQKIKAPRIIITEHGCDDVSDIKQWSNTLEKTPGYNEIRGWRSLQRQWGNWYITNPGWLHDRTYFEMLKYLDQHVYANSPVEAQLLFTWSTSEQWAQFDVSRATEFQSYLETYAKGVPSPVPTPKPVEPPKPPEPAPLPVPEVNPMEVVIAFNNAVMAMNAARSSFDKATFEMNNALGLLQKYFNAVKVV